MNIVRLAIGKIRNLSPRPLITRRTVAIFAVVLTIFLSIAAGAYVWEGNRLYKLARQDIDDKMSPYQHALINQLEKRRGQLRGLTAFAKTSRQPAELDEDFNVFARGLLTEEAGIRAVEIAPAGVIRYVYPLKGNEAAMDADLINDKRSAVRRDVNKGIATGRTILGGPYKLLQGKQGFVVREPIYNADGSFWALSQLVFNMDSLISDTSLDQKDLTFRFALRTDAGDIIYGDSAIFKEQPVVKINTVMDRTIEMAGLPLDGWDAAITADLRRFLAADIAVALLLAVIITGALDRQRYLGDAVLKKTTELAGVNNSLTRINRLYSMITAINEAIIHATSEEILYDDVCRIAVDEGGFKMSWIGLVDDGDQTVNPVAMAGAVEGYLDKIKISVRDIPEGRGPTGTSIRENRTLTSSNIDDDLTMAPWCAEALKRGYHASGAFPIRAGDSAIGALMVYDSKPGVFMEEEIALLEEITADISFALEKITQEKDLEHAASFPKVNPSPIVEFHASGLVLYHNEAAAKALERAGLSDRYEIFKPPDTEALIKLFVENPGIGTQYREAVIGERVYGETITYFRDNDTIRIYTLDITEKKRFENELIERQAELEKSYTELKRTLTMYDVLGRISEAIIKSRDKPELFREACCVLTEIAGYDLAGIVATGQKNGKLKLLASSHKDPRDASFAKGFVKVAEANDNITGSIKTKKPFICLDIDNCSCSDKWKEDLRAPGFSIYGIFPIIAEDKTTGGFAVFARDPGLLREDEIGLLERVAGNISYALGDLDRRAELAVSFKQKSKTLDDTVKAIANLAERKDPYTVGHEKKVVDLALAIGLEMGLDGNTLDGLKVAATLHDVGKMYIPTEILSKPGKLTELEFSMIKAHPRYSYEALSEIAFPWPVADIALQHHERVNGSGYPEGLKGEDILVEAKILAVADVIEAMASHRPYRPALEISEAIDEIKNNKGTLYDKRVVLAALAVIERGFKF